MNEASASWGARAWGAKASPRQLKLTPRQRQILSLLCQGKANKEIAQDLEISLGTVKQHIAALFKRMNVQNRSMAVAQGKDLFAQESVSPSVSHAISGLSADIAEDLLLIRRPCIVLALAIPPLLDPVSGQAFSAALKELATDARAFLMARGEQGSILLFGIRAPSPWDATRVVLLLRRLRHQLGEQGLFDPAALTAALDCGMAVISIDARGRWTGDTVATPVISVTRRRLSQCQPGTLGIGNNFLRLLQVFHGLESSSLGDRISFGRIERLLSLDFTPSAESLLYPSQWQRLTSLPDSEASCFQLLGRQGIGKSHLCRSLVAWVRAQGGVARYLRVLPEARAAALYDADTGVPMTVEQAGAALRTAPEVGQGLLVIDDVDLLPPASRATLLAELEWLLGAGCRVVLTARAPVSGGLDSVRLPGLDAAGLEQLLAGANARNPGQLPRRQDAQALLECTEGVPLFALEWPADSHQHLSLPVLLTLATELDRYRLDWRLLQVLNEAHAPCTFERIQALTAMPRQEIEDQVREAVRAGLLQLSGSAAQPDLKTAPLSSQCSGLRRVGFASPLVQRGVAGILV
ncbi:MAG: LuxR C-terminal-related transcriptional regulator [Lamprobacter sp.]|uniref:LuxR C-terminal-related transcriptional regulator n=1 Tax=Lamprobacter sp. TaxID=3100796 RepID=UPI002B2598B5|nr:LuxR C-terminal-related transcriptional regulator [Lamprobacter sp.]MEA3642057.1 LuxR C-terminal-related transcriptional regulator [Lamprobacter sp.]